MKTAIYVRVSTDDQSIEMQTRAIEQFLQTKGITRFEIYADEGLSGASTVRPALNRLLNDCKRGAIELLVVYKLDRLFRSLSHLMATLSELNKYGTQFIAVQDQIDMTTAAGRLQFHIIGAFAQFERDLISQRTKAGMANAKAKGIKIGRHSTITPEVRTKVLELRTCNISYTKIATSLQLSVGSVQRILKRAKVSEAGADQ